MESDSYRAIIETLGIEPDTILHTAQLNNGPVWQVLELDSAEAVLAIDSSSVRWPAF